MNGWFIGVIIALVVLILLMSDIKIRFCWKRQGENDRISASIIGLFGLLRYGLQIPAIRFKGLMDGMEIREEHYVLNLSRPVRESKRRLTPDLITRRFRGAQKSTASAINKGKWLKQTLSHVRLTEIRWQTRIGLGEAAETGIFTGVLWGMKSGLLGYILKYVQLKTMPRFDVQPEYNREYFATDASCTARIRLGFVLLAAWLYFVRIIRKKEGIRSWKNILFKA